MLVYMQTKIVDKITPTAHSSHQALELAVVVTVPDHWEH